jgi:hypothetical protein
VRDVHQRGQLVIVRADDVVPVVYHCTLHWPHTHNMYEFTREIQHERPHIQHDIKVDERGVEGA